VAVALLGGATWQLLDIPDEPWNQVLDVLMTLVLVLFWVEMILSSVVERDYFLSWFCLMDFAGTVSMVFEISYMLGDAGKLNTLDAGVDTVLLRSARAVKVGARAGRLARLGKFLSLLHYRQGAAVDVRFPAKAFSQRLTKVLSTKIFVLVVTLVLVTPLLQPVKEEGSMRAWSQMLEADYHQEFVNNLTLSSFQGSVQALVTFYSETNYFPFRLEGFGKIVRVGNMEIVISGEAEVQGREPRRRQNIVRQQVDQCLFSRDDCQGGAKAAIYFDFDAPNQLVAGMDIVMLVFVILIMVVASADLTQTMNALVVQPIERMLAVVRTMAAEVMNQVWTMGEMDEEMTNAQRDQHAASGHMTELEGLQLVLEKLAKISSIHNRKHIVDEADMKDVCIEGQGIIMDMMNLKFAPPVQSDNAEPSATPLYIHHAVMEGSLPVDISVINSWDLDLLTLDGGNDGCSKVMFHIFFNSELGKCTGSVFIDVATFQRFHAEVMAGYLDHPYHNYTHGCDVTHTVCRLLSETKCEKWTSNVEQYALLVSALCHDVGHWARANPFLVDTRHEVALLYNDSSPLENLHCAKLFEICTHDGADVFKNLSGAKYKQARQVCVTTILHTDNAGHFAMVKDLCRRYEESAEVCEAQASVQDGVLTEAYIQDVLGKDSLTWLAVFLHLADVSNPLKPFQICQAWAWRVLEEFFAQGDEEKRLGIPVGFLNDREKVNGPGSQHGFICFLVAPLVKAATNLFPALFPLASQMGRNLDEWCTLWIAAADPSEEEIAKKRKDVKRIQDEAEHLMMRTKPKPKPSQRSSAQRGSLLFRR